MKRLAVFVIVALVVTGGIGAVGTAAGANQEPTDNDTEENESGVTNLPPHAKAFGQFAEMAVDMQGDFEERQLNEAVENASNDSEKGEVISNQTKALDKKLENLKERRSRLYQKYENGTISETGYYIQMAAINERIENVKELANETADHAKSLPPQARENMNVNVTALNELRENASNMTGLETSEIAQRLHSGDSPVPEHARNKSAHGKENGQSGDSGQPKGKPENPGAGGNESDDEPRKPRTGTPSSTK